MVQGLRDAGCKITHISTPERAPFVVAFETSAGERMGIVAYAFLTTRTVTKNRPEDERSFQIKYGSKESYAHDNKHDNPKVNFQRTRAAKGKSLLQILRAQRVRHRGGLSPRCDHQVGIPLRPAARSSSAQDMPRPHQQQHSSG